MNEVIALPRGSKGSKEALLLVPDKSSPTGFALFQTSDDQPYEGPPLSDSARIAVINHFGPVKE